MHSYVAEAREIRFSALLDEETYQERLASYLTKMLQRIRNSWHVA